MRLVVYGPGDVLGHTVRRRIERLGRFPQRKKRYGREAADAASLLCGSVRSTIPIKEDDEPYDVTASDRLGQPFSG